jgi:maltose alpha-D-glucosyltransferase/alpha-amylase
MLLAEANQWPEDAARYFGDGDECHMNFHFPIMPRLFMSIHMEDRFPIIDILRQTPELHPTCQWAMFLRNHDELTLEMVTEDERDYMYRAYANESQARINLGIRRRLAPLVGNDRRKMELLNGLLFSMPGTPVLYYGDEIGMGDNVYLGDRNGVRTPMQWSTDRNAGFSRANPQRMILPIIIDPEYHYESVNVEAQENNPNSLLWWTKRLVALRKRFTAFGRGSVEFLHPSNPRVLAFIRRFGDEIILVVANLSRHVQFVELDLSSMKGMVPIELIGRTKFPTIGDLPYLLTLGGHDFYWFSVEPSRVTTQEQRLSDLGPVPITCTSVDTLLFGSERSYLEEALPAYLDAREWTTGAIAGVQIVEAIRIARDGETPLVLTVVRVDYNEGEPETFVLPLLVLPAGAPLPPGTLHGAVVAHLATGGAKGVQPSHELLVEASGEAAGRILLDSAGRGATYGALGGKVAAGLVPGAAVDGASEREARVISSDRLGVSVAFGGVCVVKLYYRMEEGTAPELEIGRYLDSKGLTGITPRVLGYVEYRVPRSEPVTLALIEEYLVNEGTAWQHARSELGRVYERALAQPSGNPSPVVRTEPLLELAFAEPLAEHAELIGAYREAAMRLGKRTAELHVALAASTDPSFEPKAYSAMDQRSKYQTARNQVGRVLASLRRNQYELPASAHAIAQQLLDAEEAILARFEPLLTQRIDAAQIRHHGDLQLRRVLFTGKDFVILDVGGARDRRLSARRRKGGAFRDVASMLRSFHYAAATTLHALRPEDQARAEPWGWIWVQAAAAAFLRGYLETADGAPFLPKSQATRAVLLETALLEKAFGELRNEMRDRPEMAWIPLQAIVRMIRRKR